MFAFLSSGKDLLKSGLLHGMTDVHCHLLPGIDDGVSSVEEARMGISYMESLGVKRMFLTPHIMFDLPDNNPLVLRDHFDSFVKSCPSSIEFRLCGEYMLDTAFAAQREMGLLTLGKTHVLVETSYLSAPIDLRSMLYDLMMDGFQPILAHPERYQYMKNEGVYALKREGYKFQLNLMSLAGTYGRNVMASAREFLEEGVYDFVGSDFHNQSVYTHALSRIHLTRSQLKSIERLLKQNEALW